LIRATIEDGSVTRRLDCARYRSDRATETEPGNAGLNDRDGHRCHHKRNGQDYDEFQKGKASAPPNWVGRSVREALVINEIRGGESL
jgi:hypothetical protein